MSTAVAVVRPTLTESEIDERVKCEKILSRGFAQFLAQGAALSTIITKKLYRSTHDTIKDYCREKWDTDWRQAIRCVSAVEIDDKISTDPFPSELCYRMLEEIPEARRDDVAKKAFELAGKEKPTSTNILAAAVELGLKKKTKKKAKRVKPEQVDPCVEFNTTKDGEVLVRVRHDGLDEAIVIDLESAKAAYERLAVCLESAETILRDK